MTVLLRGGRGGVRRLPPGSGIIALEQRLVGRPMLRAFSGFFSFSHKGLEGLEPGSTPGCAAGV